MNCETCPIRESIETHQAASQDSSLAQTLAEKQGILSLFDGDSRGLLTHFKNTTATIRIGCVRGLLCKKVV